MNRNRPEKRENLLESIHQRIAQDRFLITFHAQERKLQRSISLQQVKFVLLHGYHEKRKDQFDEVFNAWNYAIRGRTFDLIDLRVIVSFDEEDDLLIITTFEVGKR